MRNPLWKQDTPAQQLIALRMAVEGHLSNLEDGIITCDQFLAKTTPFLRQIEELSPFLNNGSWES